MAIKKREYLLTIDKYKRPLVVEGNEAIALLLVRLLLLNPGSDPLHPAMGVGLQQYRYALSLDALTKRIQDQIETYLPDFQDVTVNIIRTPDRTANIEISIGDSIFVYESAKMPVEINLDEIKAG